MGRTLDYSTRRQMQLDLIEAYKKVAPTSWTQKEAYERMVKQPAPRFYISRSRAFSVLAPMMKGDFERVDLMMPGRRRMYYALYDAVCKLVEKPTNIGRSLWDIMPDALLSPAPEFFIGWEQAKRIRRWMKHGIIKSDGSLDKTRNLFYTKPRTEKEKKK